MTRDRLEDLMRAAETENAANGDVTIDVGNGFSNGGFDAADEDKLTEALGKIETIWTLVHQLHVDTADLKKLHVEILNSAWTSEKLTAELEEKNRDIQLTITIARSKLEELTKRVPKEQVNWYEPVVSRLLRIHCNSLQRAVKDAIIEYNNTLMQHQERCAELVRQQMRIVRRSVTNEEFLQEIENRDQNPFTDNILLETMVARQALDDLHTRQKELQKVENTLQELRDMFVNMAVLIEKQGDIIDNIEEQVRNTKDYVEEARTTVQKAKVLRKKYRKRKWCLIYTIVAVILIVVVVLLIVYLPGIGTSPSPSPSSTSTTKPVDAP